MVAFIKRMTAPCPKCHRLALEREEDAANADGRRCGELVPIKVYEKHTPPACLARNIERHPRARCNRPDEEPPPFAAGRGGVGAIAVGRVKAAEAITSVHQCETGNSIG